MCRPSLVRIWSRSAGTRVLKGYTRSQPSDASWFSSTYSRYDSIPYCGTRQP